MTLPDELGNWPAHRVPDRDEGVDTERVGDGDHIVGTVDEPKRLLAAQPAGMAAMVERNNSIVLGERAIAGEVVEVGRCCPSMQQDEGGGTWRACDVANEDRPEPWKLQLATWREVRNVGLARFARDGQSDSTFKILTLSWPFGA